LPRNAKTGSLYKVLGNKEANNNTLKQCYNVIIDPQGYIWLGTPKGILIYDGKKFTPFEVPSKDHEIVVMVKDSIFIIGCSFAGEIIRINTQTRKVDLIRGNNSTWDEEGNNYHYCIRAGDSTYFIRFNGSSLCFKRATFLSTLTYLEPWILPSSGGVLLYNIIIKKYGLDNAITNEQTQSEIIHYAHNLIFYDSSFGIGCSIYLNKNGAFKKIFEDKNKLKAGNYIFSYIFNGNSLWISWQKGELQFISDINKPAENVNKNIDHTLNGIRFGSMGIDLQGNVLMSSTTSGLYLFPQQQKKEVYYPLNERNIFFSSDVHYIGFQDGSMYIGYNLPIVDEFINDGSITRYCADTGINKIPVKLFYKTKSQKHYLFTDVGYAFDSKTKKSTIYNPGSIKDCYINNNTVYAKQKYYNYLIVPLNDSTKAINTNTQITSNTFCTSNKNGLYYFGSTRGLYLDTQKIKGPLQDERILMLRNLGNHILIGTTNGLWIGTTEKNTLRVNKLQLNGSNFCQQIDWDGEKFYYLLTESTLEQINSKTFETQTLYRNSELPNGMNLNCFALNNGKIYIGTTKGIIVLNPSTTQLTNTTSAPPFHIINIDSSITNFLAKNTIARYDKNLLLNYRLDVLDFVGHNYEIKWWLENENGIQLLKPSKLNNQELSIAKPSPGIYTLLVEISSKQLGWKSIQKHRISILPLWWQQIWVQILSAVLAFILLIFTTYKVVKNIERQRYLKLRNKNTLLMLKNKLLLSRLKPHFIFNAFNPLQSLILKKNTTGSLLYIEQFSQLMRNAITIFDKKYIPLSKEIEFLNQYVYIQQVRFSNGFSFEMKIPEKTCLDSIYIPPMIIQPLIENAIDHGINNNSSKEKKTIQLTIDIDKINKQIIIDVQDEGNGFPDNFKPRNNRGMGLIKERIAILKTETGIGSILFENNNIGAHVQIILPLTSAPFTK
jgi:hypothetical protein